MPAAIDSEDVAYRLRQKACSLLKETVVDRLRRLKDAQRPSTVQKLTSFARAVTRDGVKLYVYDPNDVLQDLVKSAKVPGLLAEKTVAIMCAEKPQHDVEDDRSMSVTLPPSTACGHRGWLHPPDKLIKENNAHGLALWLAARAYAFFQPDAATLINALLESGECSQEKKGRHLRYSLCNVPSKSSRFGAQPWPCFVQKAIGDKASDKNTLRAPLQGAPMERLELARQTYDDNMVEDTCQTMIDILNPCLPASSLCMPLLKRNLTRNGVRPFKVKFTHIEVVQEKDEVGTWVQHRYDLISDEVSAKTFDSMRQRILQSLTSFPGKVTLEGTPSDNASANSEHKHVTTHGKGASDAKRRKICPDPEALDEIGPMKRHIFKNESNETSCGRLSLPVLKLTGLNLINFLDGSDAKATAQHAMTLSCLLCEAGFGISDDDHCDDHPQKAGLNTSGDDHCDERPQKCPRRNRELKTPKRHTDGCKTAEEWRTRLRQANRKFTKELWSKLLGDGPMCFQISELEFCSSCASVKLPL